ncbi:Ivy family c-type lysozyme inhibitor [Variovorax sp. J22G73]|uniref:Ivy family c-type lysozyme inhibitor n=1 Tax=unclassified Variovorax TaxID=663243 RepID=UPI000D5E7B1C|nr:MULTISPECIES: Ivy family c-type lysozyme inhibitor [unclassified Variovorax]MDM0003338.1 Ivy family c-type lysozyme inhibitor [Variovorax sp. J22R203]MDM0096996.1 Ivy family c-type lysozyme inhibitor [Variovorax sp. J22G73]
MKTQTKPTATLLAGALLGPLLAALLCPAAAWSQQAAGPDGLKPDAMNLYGGRWSTACADAGAPTLQVRQDMLIAESGKRRVVGRAPQTAYSFFGNSPPPAGFDVALIGDAGKAGAMTFLVYRDGRGQSITLDADKPIAGQLGPEMMKLRYWRCDGAARAAPPPAEAPAAKVPPPPTGSPAALAQGPAMQKAWRTALGPRENDRWLVRREGPAPEPQWVTVDGTRYLLHAFCKPHDCYDNNAIALYDQGSGRIYGLVQRDGRNRLVGAPPAALAPQLDKLWREQWRKKS